MRTLVAAAVAVATLAVPAEADHVTAYCGLLTVSQSGGAYHGGMWGAVAAPGEDVVTIRCEIRVGGVPAAATPTGGPTPGGAATAGEIRYERTSSDVVEACAVYTTGHGTGTSCRPTTTTNVPPCQALADCDVVAIALETLNDLVVEEIDPRVCAVLAEHRPSAPPYVDTTAEGDVYVLGEFFWDCPPYQPAG